MSTLEVVGHSDRPQTNTKTTSAAPPRLTYLDGLRFSAAVAVVLYHFTAIKSNAWGEATASAWPGLGKISQYGYLGVQLFFIISGFVILMTAWGTSLERFLASRISRLFPAYWLAVALTAALVWITSTGGAFRWDQIALNFTMTHTSYAVADLDGSYWTLWAELRFYALLGVFLAVGITRKRVLLVASVWPVLAALSETKDNGLVSAVLISGWAPYFAGGMVLYLVYRFGGDLITYFVLGLNILMCLHLEAVHSASRQFANTGRHPHTGVASAIVLACFIAVWVCTTARGRNINWSWLTPLGALTYPLYLIHQKWGLYIISHLRHNVGLTGALLITLAIVLIAASLIQRCVERPLTARLKRSILTNLRQ